MRDQHKNTSTKKSALITCGIMFGLIFGLAYIKYLKISEAIAQSKNFAPPPEAVTALVVQREIWPQTIQAVGSIMPVQGITLKNEEAGTVTRIAFESGSEVNAGDVLIELDSSVELANLNGALARLELARKALKRVENLRGNDAMSASDLENAQSKYQVAESEVQSLRATIAKKKISAPFSGQTGIRQVNLGQYLAPGSEIVALQALDVMYINFSLPQQRIQDVQPGQVIQLKVDAYPGAQFAGKISALNPQVDELTRNVDIQATVPNPDKRLRAGMFANVTVILPAQENVLTLPQTAISYAPFGDTIFIIESMTDPQGKEYLGVKQQLVHLGPSRGDRVVITEGLKEGQQVVTSGLFKLRPGAAVVVNNSIVPSNDLRPTPEDT